MIIDEVEGIASSIYAAEPTKRPPGEFFTKTPRKDFEKRRATVFDVGFTLTKCAFVETRHDEVVRGQDAKGAGPANTCEKPR